ncbi:DUF695 domain-containing protein [Pontibacter chitinilyticus]|uniref:DUF695 domain-containing protein n=1 Tax=Pontibacter chitinilyticus TaxID=2674989 RepID=UPI003218FAC5
MENLKQLLTEKDTWNGAEGENEGTPFLLRYRPYLHDFIETKKYNQRLTILWGYESDNDSLMPSDEDMELMRSVEDSLVESLEDDLQAILAFVYLGQSQKEWHWYTSDIAETGRRINEALSDFERLPIELSVEDDQEWSEYLSVLEGSDDSAYQDTEEE